MQHCHGILPWLIIFLQRGVTIARILLVFIIKPWCFNFTFISIFIGCKADITTKLQY